MSQALADTDRYFTREEYRQWCEAEPRGRFERVDGRIVAMAAERIAHVLMKGSVYSALTNAVKRAGVACQVLTDGATIETGDNDFEPDAIVNCGPRLHLDGIAAPNPVVVVEVLSPSTSTVDTGQKLVGYFQVPSVCHYLIVNPHRRAVIIHRRYGEAIHTGIVGSGAIDLDPPGITITTEELYNF